jgi:Protein of unknown function (DUF2608)
MIRLKPLTLSLALGLLLLPASLIALPTPIVNDVHKAGHHYSKVDKYMAVAHKVDELLKQGVLPKDILVLTDWDNVINAPGAWEQKNYQGDYIDAKSKRMLLEHEVDHKLRDQDLHDIQQNIIKKGVRIVVVTARPPVIDTEISTLSGVGNLMDARHPENPDKIHFDKIVETIKTVLDQTDKNEILEHAKKKVDIMQERSGVRLTNQQGLNTSFVEDVNGLKIVYHDGFSFVGHDKGAALPVLLEKLGGWPAHIIIIDDSSDALKSYHKNLDHFTRNKSKAHLLHYKKPVS